jgi:uncharacterized protein (TIGR03000 family)
MQRILAVAAVGVACLFLLPTLRGDEGDKKDKKDDKEVKKVRVLLRVLVKEGAELEIENVQIKSKQTGTERKFISPPVPADKMYVYRLKATWKENGVKKTATKKVRFKPDKEVVVDLRVADDDKPKDKDEDKKKDGDDKPKDKDKKDGDKKKDKDDEEKDEKGDVVYWPTPQNVVDKMLEMARVKKDDLVYDLGSGDGRIPITAAKRYGCKGFGYEIKASLVKKAIANAKENKVDKLVSFKKQDILADDFDVSKATVVALYLLPDINLKLLPKLEKLKPGSRVVSHDFRIKGLKAKDEVTIVAVNHEGQENEHIIYLYEVPFEKEKVKPKK